MGTFFTNFHTQATVTKESIPRILCSSSKFDYRHSIQYKLSSLGYYTSLLTTNLFMLEAFSAGWDEAQYLPQLNSRRLASARHQFERLALRNLPTWMIRLLRLVKRAVTGGPHLSAREMFMEALQRIPSFPKPFFLWIHLMDTHLPYTPSDSPVSVKRIEDLCTKVLKIFWTGEGALTPGELALLRQLYRACVSDVDKEVWKFYVALPQNTLFVFMSDHGEELGENGHYSHSEARSVPQLTHIPLIIAPGPRIKVHKCTTTDAFKRILGSFVGVEI